jgi:hypothetical protein
MGQFNVDHLQATNITSSGILQALGGFKFPSVTTSTRPSSPIAGQTVYNSDEVALEVYDGSAWQTIAGGGVFPTWANVAGRPSSGLVNAYTGINIADSKLEIYDLANTEWIQIGLGQSNPITASGGDNEYTPGDGFKYHVFTSDGTLTVSAGNDDVQYVVVAGVGGGGGGDVGCGGGAGGYRSNVPGFPSGGGSAAEPSMTLAPGSYPVIVGPGGPGSSSSPSDASDGGESSFNGIVSAGGGGGASWGSGEGRSGGSGGGSASTRTGAAGTANQGFAGASGRGGPHYPQGGGGGAGGAGEPSRNNDFAGNGGFGLVNPFGAVTSIGERVNKSYWLAGGGGGGVESNAETGRGGLGGGGIGGRQSPNTDPSPGSANTGGGGGGEDSGTGGAGGSGVVMIRYAF